MAGLKIVCDVPGRLELSGECKNLEVGISDLNEMIFDKFFWQPPDLNYRQYPTLKITIEVPDN